MINILSCTKFYAIKDDLGNYCDKDTIHKCSLSDKWTYMVKDEVQKKILGEMARIYSKNDIIQVLKWLQKNIHRVEVENRERKFEIVEVEI
ncbi:hypothetical protein [Ruminiclostridium cellobioparum]|uniref:Uncharacterized protein n=1 Tax=Ruminiclostridium cellobioparum subsp. termitidis CT1112 TaxID=1195236 RepID=S0FUP8_RUMCE|nr:hypothetical protein [Ruminiclostridium cellobioparum]EMS74041.1 hypothetical protein CTER_5126 [Ruminiclostridium cellobioparum subsp. termitidis CT1112]